MRWPCQGSLRPGPVAPPSHQVAPPLLPAEPPLLLEEPPLLPGSPPLLTWEPSLLPAEPPLFQAEHPLLTGEPPLLPWEPPLLPWETPLLPGSPPLPILWPRPHLTPRFESWVLHPGLACRYSPSREGGPNQGIHQPQPARAREMRLLKITARLNLSALPLPKMKHPRTKNFLKQGVGQVLAPAAWTHCVLTVCLTG